MHSPALHQLVVPDALGGGGLGMKKMWLAIRVLPLHIWGILGMSHILSTLLFLPAEKEGKIPSDETILSKYPAAEGTRQTCSKCGFPSGGHFTRTMIPPRGITVCILHTRKLIWGDDMNCSKSCSGKVRI